MIEPDSRDKTRSSACKDVTGSSHRPIRARIVQLGQRCDAESDRGQRLQYLLGQFVGPTRYSSPSPSKYRITSITSITRDTPATPR